LLSWADATSVAKRPLLAGLGSLEPMDRTMDK
jgi:hypothetical protein